MTQLDLLILRFLLASCGCMVAGLGVWVLTTLCRRHLADFSLQRSMWLMSQITIVAAFLVIFLPHSERLRMIPPIDLPDVVEASLNVPSGTASMAIARTASAEPREDTHHRSWLVFAAETWLLIYLFGLTYSIIKLWRAQRILHGLAVAGSPVHALHQHDGFSSILTRPPAPEVIEVNAPISPMLFGLLRPRLLLPRHLRSFDVTQQKMIVEHELTHLRRLDLQWMSASIFLQTTLWFNPFMWMLRENLSWAQELGCDRDVLQGRPQAQRKAYAAALVAQLRLQHPPVTTALAFGGVNASSLADRISLIRKPPEACSGPWARLSIIGALVSIVVTSLALQPAIASHIDLLSKTTSPTLKQSLLFSSDLSLPKEISCTELSDAANGKRLVHEGQCDERVTPASTFNIAVSLMGYDSGILINEHAPTMPFRADYIHWNPSWRTATDPTNWIKNSVLWYAQQVTTQLGEARFQRYVKVFNYGNYDVSGDAGKDNGLTLSWVSSSLKISPVEQVDFLRKVVNRDFPLTEKSYDMTFRIMKPEILKNGWEIRGKTGTAAVVLPDGRDDAEHQYGWFVGWAKKGQRTIVFARLLLDQRQKNDPAGHRVKEAFLHDLPARLDAL